MAITHKRETYSTFFITNGLTYKHQLFGMAEKLSMNKLQPRKTEARLFPTVISFSVHYLSYSILSLFLKVKDPVILLEKRVHIVLCSAVTTALIYSQLKIEISIRSRAYFLPTFLSVCNCKARIYRFPL